MSATNSPISHDIADRHAESSLQRYARETKALLRLAWPIVGAQLLSLGMVITDNMMVARLGKYPLAALAMAGTIYSALYIVVMGILSAMGPAIAHAHGSGEFGAISRWVRQGWRLSLVLSLADIAVLLNAKDLLIFFGQDPEIAALAQTYLSAMAWGVPAQFLYFCGRTLCEGTSDSRPSIIIAALGASLNVVLNWALIYGHGGFPALGVKGSGYATSSVHWVMALAILAYIATSRRYRPYGSLATGPWLSREVLADFLRTGAPISGAMLAEMAFFGGATLVVGTIGTRALASHQIALNAASFTFMIPLGLAFAVGIRVGQFRGQGDHESMVCAGRTGFLVTAVIELFCAITFLSIPEAVTSLYTADPELAGPANLLLRIAGIFQLFDGLQVVGISALRGLRDTKVPFLATVLSFWLIGTPLALFLLPRLGAQGVWYGMVLGLGLAAVLHLARFQLLTMRGTTAAGD